ncbi:hypothetical protein HPP92_020737 [Vanilla planifolia]|uniref:Pectinesterase inhibitor domain-containing protein n=1 Tax=Vanilla planifolia TaxID=51239 RepID=A0A835PXI5_VANPL|nr:hypothetical protein HPP92_020737 [Vanilla planifolia]
MTTSSRAAMIFAVVLTFVLRASHGRAAVSTPADFIRTSCKETLYPELCEKSLSVYAPTVRSPRLLARAAISLTAKRATAASNFVRSMSAQRGKRLSVATDRGSVHDCLETLAESIDGLQRSAREVDLMGRYGSQSFRWHLGNAQTWVSAALTDVNTCLDGLAQDRSAALIRPLFAQQVVRVSRLTSNALALLNRLQ